MQGDNQPHSDVRQEIACDLIIGVKHVEEKAPAGTTNNADSYDDDDNASYSDDSDGRAGPHVEPTRIPMTPLKVDIEIIAAMEIVRTTGKETATGEMAATERMIVEESMTVAVPRDGGRDREEVANTAGDVGAPLPKKIIQGQEHVQSTSSKNRPSYASSDVFGKLVTAQLCDLPIQVHTSLAKRVSTQDPVQAIFSHTIDC